MASFIRAMGSFGERTSTATTTHLCFLRLPASSSLKSLKNVHCQPAEKKVDRWQTLGLMADRSVRRMDSRRRIFNPRLKNCETPSFSGMGDCQKSARKKFWKAFSMARDDELEALLQARYDWEG